MARKASGLRRHTGDASVSHSARMKVQRLFAFVLSLLVIPLFARAVSTANPEDTLRDLVARQQTLFAEAEKENPNFDEANFHSQLQQLTNDYDLLIKDHPNFASAYVAYGMLLSRVDMRKEAANMFLRANQLDKNIALVKNQLGNYCAEEGKVLEAANYYLSAIQLEPKQPLYHYQLGSILTEARDDFLKSGNWSREAIDKAMHEAFRQAMELSPGNVAYAYRFGESFYDLEHPEWEEALEFWRALELKVAPGLEKQTIRLHEANVLMKEKKFEEADKLLQTVTEKPLLGQKQKLLDQFPKNSEGK
jgi:tetratricopeptide (TPR) repeat protein